MDKNDKIIQAILLKSMAAKADLYRECVVQYKAKRADWRRVRRLTAACTAASEEVSRIIDKIDAGTKKGKPKNGN